MLQIRKMAFVSILLITLCMYRAYPNIAFAENKINPGNECEALFLDDTYICEEMRDGGRLSSCLFDAVNSFYACVSMTAQQRGDPCDPDEEILYNSDILGTSSPGTAGTQISSDPCDPDSDIW